MHTNSQDENPQADKYSVINLPDVNDIPGQENIKPPRLKEFEDTTISSSGEEGDALWNETKIVTEDDWNVSDVERDLLRKAAAYTGGSEEEELKKAIPDTTDADGDQLNETFSYKDLSAKDLDIPDEYEDDEDEELGKEPLNH
jgi:hypothetical protein